MKAHRHGGLRMSTTPVISTETELTDQSAVSPDRNASQETPEENPWITFFDAMRNAPRDEHWHEFMRVMKERPMNQLPVERNLFGDPE